MSFYHQSWPGAVEWCDLQRGEVRANQGMREKDLRDSPAVSIAARYAKTMFPLSQMCVNSCHFVNLGILWAKRVQFGEWLLPEKEGRPPTELSLFRSWNG
jgi:hypothetical protein